MKPYTRHLRCEKCGTSFTLMAERKDGGRAVSTFRVACPACGRRVELEVSCDLQEETIQVVLAGPGKAQ